MDKRELYQKAEKIMNQALESAKHSAKVVKEKAGEETNITKLLIEKATLEHRVSKKFAELGHAVYEKSSNAENQDLFKDKKIQGLLKEAKQIEDEIDRIEVNLKKERKVKK